MADTMSASDKIVVSGFRHFFATADGEGKATAKGDLAIRSGEFVTLVGPSGCGKTTLLKAIAGFIRPTEGTIHCDGKLVQGPGRERGVVFQELAILPWGTVRRNIGHGLEIAGVSRAERDKTVRRLIELTGLTGFEERYPHELSGGMRHRVAVARAARQAELAAPPPRARPRLGILYRRSRDAGPRRTRAQDGARGAWRRAAVRRARAPGRRCRMSTALAPARAAPFAAPAGFVRMFSGVKVLLPFAALVALWWT